jgi:hypothetical protein
MELYETLVEDVSMDFKHFTPKNEKRESNMVYTM